jgi:hypothetical protein
LGRKPPAPARSGDAGEQAKRIASLADESLADRFVLLSRELHARPLPGRVAAALSRRLCAYLEPLDAVEIFLLDWAKDRRPRRGWDHEAVREAFRRAHEGPLTAASARGRLVVGSIADSRSPFDGMLFDFKRFLAAMAGIGDDSFAQALRLALADQGFEQVAARFLPTLP